MHHGNTAPTPLAEPMAAQAASVTTFLLANVVRADEWNSEYAAKLHTLCIGFKGRF